MRSTKGLDPRLGKPEMLDLACNDQVAHGAGDILDRHSGIDTMLVKQVDGLNPQSAKRTLDRLSDMIRTTVHPAPILTCRQIDIETELGRDDHLVPERAQRLADDQLIFERSVDFGRV